MRAVVALVAAAAAACAGNPRPSLPRSASHPDAPTIVHVLNRLGFGARPGDLDRVRQLGLARYIDLQLHPDAITDDAVGERLRALATLTTDARSFAVDYYLPMTKARQELSAQYSGRLPPTALVRGLALPIAVASLPSPDKPMSTIAQDRVLPEEAAYNRRNQRVLQELQAAKLLRAVYSERQLEEVLVDFWFNHFNVFAGKIADRPVVLEFERDVIRPRVLGRFRDLLGAVAKSPAMLFYLDNWLSRDGRLNENYARELMELHTLGVDGGYTQGDVVEVARAFTGWTMRSPREGTGFEFTPRTHDSKPKRVLGTALPAGRGIEDGEQVLDLLARHPSTARFIATKLARRFVADDPPRSIVDRAARVFERTGGDLREVVRAIVTSRELFDPAMRRAKLKTPFEFVASALRATGADVTSAQGTVGTIAALGEPLYQCQPPTGYPDRASTWMATGALIARLNFAEALVDGRVNGVRVDLARLADANADAAAERVIARALGGEVSPATRRAADASGPRVTAAVRTGLVIGAPEFQRR